MESLKTAVKLRDFLGKFIELKIFDEGGQQNVFRLLNSSRHPRRNYVSLTRLEPLTFSKTQFEVGRF